MRYPFYVVCIAGLENIHSSKSTKSELLTNRKFWKMPRKSFVIEFLCGKLQASKLQPPLLLVLKLWKIPDKTSAVEFLFTEAVTNRFSTE